MSRSMLALALEARTVYDDAVAELGPELCGFSVVDLLADNIPDAPLSDLRTAMVVAGIETA